MKNKDKKKHEIEQFHLLLLDGNADRQGFVKSKVEGWFHSGLHRPVKIEGFLDEGDALGWLNENLHQFPEVVMVRLDANNLAGRGFCRQLVEMQRGAMWKPLYFLFYSEDNTPLTSFISGGELSAVSVWAFYDYVADIRDAKQREKAFKRAFGRPRFSLIFRLRRLYQRMIRL